MPTLRILLIDDHAVVREGYKRYLDGSHDFEVVAEADSAEAAGRLLREIEVDAIVLDLTLPGQDGFTFLRRTLAKHPELRILVFSMHNSPMMLSQALRAGARGYVTKSSPPDVLLEGLHAVARGELYLSPDLKAALPEAMPLDLSAREIEIIRHFAAGQTKEEIAAHMGVSVKTVANNLSAIKQKLEVESDLALFRHAQAQGLI